MPTPEVEREVEQLRSQLEVWNYQYYVLDQPTVPDAEYDRIMRRLQALEDQYPQLVRSDSPSQRVGGQPLSEFGQVLSLIHISEPTRQLASSRMPSSA